MFRQSGLFPSRQRLPQLVPQQTIQLLIQLTILPHLFLYLPQIDLQLVQPHPFPFFRQLIEQPLQCRHDPPPIVAAGSLLQGKRIQTRIHLQQQHLFFYGVFHFFSSALSRHSAPHGILLLTAPLLPATSRQNNPPGSHRCVTSSTSLADNPAFSNTFFNCSSAGRTPSLRLHLSSEYPATLFSKTCNLSRLGFLALFNATASSPTSFPRRCADGSGSAR